MTFRGIDYCLRCGRQLHASRLPYVGDCCAKKLTPAQLEAMAMYAAQVADPFHIPEPRPLSAEGRRNNANALAAATAPESGQLCRHDNRVGACGDCRREADPTRAAERILAEIRRQSYADRRAERVAIWTARIARGIPAPVSHPAPRPRRRPRPVPSPVPADTAVDTAEQLELLASYPTFLTPIEREIRQEREAQDAKWGEQNHPDGTGLPGDRWSADHARKVCEEAARAGTLAWRHILREEVNEAIAETDPARLRAELIQVAAVAQAWAEAIDRRAEGGEPS